VPEDQAYEVAFAWALLHVLDLDGVPPPIAEEAREALAGLAPSPGGIPAGPDLG
jgi:hypothetical protein